MCIVVDITLIVQDQDIMCIGYIYAMKDGVDMSCSPRFLFNLDCMSTRPNRVHLHHVGNKKIYICKLPFVIIFHNVCILIVVEPNNCMF